MGIDTYLSDSFAKRRAKFFGHIFRDSSGDGFVNIVEGCGQMTLKTGLASKNMVDRKEQLKIEMS